MFDLIWFHLIWFDFFLFGVDLSICVKSCIVWNLVYLKSFYLYSKTRYWYLILFIRIQNHIIYIRNGILEITLFKFEMTLFIFSEWCYLYSISRNLYSKWRYLYSKLRYLYSKSRYLYSSSHYLWSMVDYLYLVLFYLYSNLDGENICCIVYIFYRAIFVPSNNIPCRVRSHVSIDQSATSLQNLLVLNNKLLLWTSRELPIWIIGYIT